MVPEKSETWELYKVFLKILDVLLQNSLSQEEVDNLNQLVEKKHTLYMNLFQAPLKPKHNFMVHYANLIRIIGPLKNVEDFEFWRP